MPLLVALPLGLIGVWQVSAFERSLGTTVTHGLEAITRKKVQELDAYISESQVDARLVAQATDTRELLSQRLDALATRVPAGSRDYFARLADNGRYSNLLLVQPDGRVSFSLKPLAS